MNTDDSQVRRCAIEYLAEIGPEAKATLPYLGAQAETNRRATATALWRIGRDANKVVPLLLEEMDYGKRHDSRDSIRFALELLGGIGPVASVAVPAITSVIEEYDGTELAVMAKEVLARHSTT